MRCSVDGCQDTAAITSPLPLCGMDMLRVAAAHQRAVDPETPLSRILALTEIHASPQASDAELAARTGWPVEWVTSHRRAR
ncbi:hypothetical protein [Streptomyces sp. NBC_00847]|uniref:hypothetical protein n=1 Tax=Streptomyces sp. NBC_00847 TaxID=2975850 RepID=UPI00225E490B|nr:hypothetical protein [Streptomyces sp. NBC_00847]MCX4886086.1 hypothetical protein [Streptomyces sp. NBC_00847]